MPFTFAEAEELPPAAKAKTEKAARWMARLSDLRKPTHVDAVSYGLQNFWRERLTGEVRCMHIFLHFIPRIFWWPAGVPPRRVACGAGISSEVW